LNHKQEFHWINGDGAKNPARKARYSLRYVKEGGWTVARWYVKYKCPAEGPYNKYRDGTCFLAPPFPPPHLIPAPSSSSTLIKNSYILISRGCGVPRVAPEFSLSSPVTNLPPSRRKVPQIFFLHEMLNCFYRKYRHRTK